MATIVTVYTGLSAVNRPLTNAEIDANFINLNTAVSNAVSNYIRTSITATANQTNFTAQYTPGYLQVYINGIVLNSTDYTATNGTSVVLSMAAALGDIVEIVGYTIGVNFNTGIGSQNIDGGVPGSKYTGILTSISGGTATSALVDNTLPYNSVFPTITGTVEFGQTLTLNPGTWTGTPTPTFTYIWQQYPTNTIAGATGTSYTLVSSDVGKQIRASVTATNVLGSVSSNTAYTSVVIANNSAPVNTVAPVITGTLQAGQTLTASTGTWSGYPTPTYTYQWQQNNQTNIAGATSSNYTLTADDINFTVRCVVTATNSSGNTSANSASTTYITAGNNAPVNTAVPTITGIAQVGNTLTATTGTWTGTPTYTYQWINNLFVLLGTASSYTVVSGDIGKTIYCQVTATNTDGRVSANSVSTAAVTTPSNSAPVNTAAPVITGTPAVGQTLTTNTGTWSGYPTPTYTYQWIRNNINITGATTSTYIPVSGDELTTIYCRVTATNSSGSGVQISASVTIVQGLATFSFGTIPSSINEGTDGTFNVNTTNVSNGAKLWWSINNTSTVDADFSPISGFFTISGNTGAFFVSPTADTTTEGTETFTVSIRTGSTTGTVVATSGSVTINDTSTAPAATGKAIFAYGIKIPSTATNISNLVSTTGVVATDTTGVGTARSGLAAAGYGIDKGIFGYGGGPTTNITNLVSNTGAISADTTGVGTARYYLAAAGYGGDKAIFGFGIGSVSVIVNLVSNTGTVATDTTGSGTARYGLAAAGYGTDKAIFGYGADNPSTFYSMTNKVSNTGVVAADTTGVARARLGLGAAGYGGDKAIFAYGYNNSYLSANNLVSNTGVVAAENFGAGSLRAYVAAAGYGGDKAIFGYGTTSPGTSYLSETNKVSNTGTVSSNTTGVGTARYSLAAAGF